MNHSFPKIIWQTHNYKKEWLPGNFTKVIKNWQNLNPDWDYRYVDQVQRDSKVKEYPKIYEVYQYLPPIYQSDVWRLIVTGEEGGCYADMDSMCTVPLDDMITQDCEIITVSKNGHEFGNNANFIVAKDSKLVKNMVERMHFWIENNPKHFNESYAFWQFIKNVYADENSDKVSQTFKVSHSSDYKDLNYDFKLLVINDKGSLISYADYLKKYDLPWF